MKEALKPTKTIGIIGGAGVAATNKLHALIEEELTQRGAFRDSHHPEIITFYATQAPSRSMFLEGRGEDFTHDYINVGKKLQQMGAQTICMCCNTAHYRFDIIQEAIQVKMLNLIESIAQLIQKSKVRSVGLMASDGCLKGRVYERYLERMCPNVQIIYPATEFQKKVTQGICNIKNHHRFDTLDSKERPRNLFQDVKEHLVRGGGAEKVIICCTDKRVDYADKDNIDSLEVLKDLIIKEAFDE